MLKLGLNVGEIRGAGDVVEAKAIQSLFGSNAASASLALSSTKVTINSVVMIYYICVVNKIKSDVIRVRLGISWGQLEQWKQYSVYYPYTM